MLPGGRSEKERACHLGYQGKFYENVMLDLATLEMVEKAFQTRGTT